MFFVTNLTWNGLLLIPVIKRMLYLGNAFLRSDSSDSPGVANRTKPNQKPIELNRTQSFDWSSIGSAIEHNRTGTFSWVRLSSITEPNRTQSTRLVRFCSVKKQNGIQHWYALTLSRIGRNSLFNWVLARGASVRDINTFQWTKIFIV